jgi:prepilin-type N-terminal cleavage/methylation domain-containing protein
MRKQKGFTLIELLIVVAIILIISAIAIPRLLQARQTAAENSAAGTMRNIGTALATYQVKWGLFPAAASSLGGTCNATTPPSATNACVLDNVQATNIGTNPITGYDWTYTQVNSGADFTLTGNPAAGNNAKVHYFIDSGLTIHTNQTTTASATDPTL